MTDFFTKLCLKCINFRLGDQSAGRGIECEVRRVDDVIPGDDAVAVEHVEYIDLAHQRESIIASKPVPMPKCQIRAHEHRCAANVVTAVNDDRVVTRHTRDRGLRCTALSREEALDLGCVIAQPSKTP